MKISDKGLALIEEFEGFEPKAYLCPAGVWTIGHGHTKGVKEGDTITEEAAAELLKNELADEFEPKVNALVDGLVLTQGQYDALVSFAYNVGINALKQSSLLKLLKEGKTGAAADEFLRWNKSRGKELPGLTRRRQAERELFLS